MNGEYVRLVEQSLQKRLFESHFKTIKAYSGWDEKMHTVDIFTNLDSSELRMIIKDMMAEYRLQGITPNSHHIKIFVDKDNYYVIHPGEVEHGEIVKVVPEFKGKVMAYLHLKLNMTDAHIDREGWTKTQEENEQQLNILTNHPVLSKQFKISKII